MIAHHESGAAFVTNPSRRRKSSSPPPVEPLCTYVIDFGKLSEVATAYPNGLARLGRWLGVPGVPERLTAFRAVGYVPAIWAQMQRGKR